MSDNTTITVEVGVPTIEELTRIIEAWFDAGPLQNAYGVFEGDDQGIEDLPPEEQRLIQESALRYWWLAAARKRASKP
jgi:hypothetical protein